MIRSRCATNLGEYGKLIIQIIFNNYYPDFSAYNELILIFLNTINSFHMLHWLYYWYDYLDNWSGMISKNHWLPKMFFVVCLSLCLTYAVSDNIWHSSDSTDIIPADLQEEPAVCWYIPAYLVYYREELSNSNELWCFSNNSLFRNYIIYKYSVVGEANIDLFTPWFVKYSHSYYRKSHYYMSLYYFKVYGLLLEYWLSNSGFVDFLNLCSDKELFIFWGISFHNLVLWPW